MLDSYLFSQKSIVFVFFFSFFFSFLQGVGSSKVNIQGDRLNMAVCSLYLVKHDLSSVHVYSTLHWTGYFLQGTRKTRPCLSGQVVHRDGAALILALAIVAIALTFLKHPHKHDIYKEAQSPAGIS